MKEEREKEKDRRCRLEKSLVLGHTVDLSQLSRDGLLRN